MLAADISGRLIASPKEISSADGSTDRYTLLDLFIKAGWTRGRARNLIRTDYVNVQVSFKKE